MLKRENCIFENEKLVSALKGLREELYQDFNKNLLAPCGSCNHGLDDPTSEYLHGKILHLYNTMAEILFKLDERSKK